jgi:ribosome-binding ATPase YchF (GTP1/OBG family)
MDVGIVGRPGSGRTTVFRALLAHRAPQASGARHAGAGIGAIRVVDPRLDRLGEQFQLRKVTPIEIVVHDLCPSLEPSFPKAELEAMKRMDVLVLVLPAFSDDSADVSIQELERLLGELGLEDLALIEGRLKHASRDKMPDVQREALERAQAALEGETPVTAAGLSEPQRAALRGYALITDRPFAAIRNVAEDRAGEPPPEAVVARGARAGIPVLSLCAALEAEMAELSPEERQPYLAEYGVQEPAGAALTRHVLAAGDIIPFFTVGEDECRAWPIARGTVARKAAGRVHSDIERGFIRAEVIQYDELEPLDGDLGEARRRGLLRLEGKDYVVQDGDVVHFRFNV